MSRVLFSTVLLGLLFVNCGAEFLDSISLNGRSLLQNTTEDLEAAAEAQREADALDAFEEEERRREEERQIVLANAREEAAEELVNFNAAETEEEQINVFVRLWRNAQGPTILVLLTTLISTNQAETDVYLGIVAESMLEADRRGFSFQISDALWSALVLVDDEEDGGPLLDAIMINLRALNAEERRSGCTYVRNLFTDAEVLAIENGYEIGFTQAFDAEEYLPLAECFYDPCERPALGCCRDEDAIASGRCRCLRREPDTCEFNLFLNTPRPIWRCNGEECSVTKCLCPDETERESGGNSSSGNRGGGNRKLRKSA